MRRPIIAGNWKMHKTIREALDLATRIKREIFDVKDADIVLCPPYTALSEVYEILMESNIELGAQDVHWEKEGAFTGEISCVMLKDVGCRYVIIGHSERRRYFGESNESVNKKVKATLEAGLVPIMCVGETLEERRAGRTFDVVADHVKNGLKGIDGELALNVVIAYEPVWAIGTGVNATKEEAEEVHSFIRTVLSKLYGQKASDEIRIQYGGSVKPDNIVELMSQPNVDGALVGGASLNAESFVEIIRGSIKAKDREG